MGGVSLVSGEVLAFSVPCGLYHHRGRVVKVWRGTYEEFVSSAKKDGLSPNSCDLYEIEWRTKTNPSVTSPLCCSQMSVMAADGGVFVTGCIVIEDEW